MTALSAIGVSGGVPCEMQDSANADLRVSHFAQRDPAAFVPVLFAGVRQEPLAKSQGVPSRLSRRSPGSIAFTYKSSTPLWPSSI
jgi:hypothetical protein